MRRWEFYRAPGGRDKVRDDVDRLRMNVHEREKLRLMMTRCAADQLVFPDVKPLTGTGGLQEIRFRQGARSFRLVFAVEEQGVLLLGLHLFVKKGRVEAESVRLAVDRHREWQRRGGASGSGTGIVDKR